MKTIFFKALKMLYNIYFYTCLIIGGLFVNFVILEGGTFDILGREIELNGILDYTLKPLIEWWILGGK